jgi:adenylate kinase
LAPFFDGLTSFMSSGPVTALVLEKEDAVRAWRELMGPTNSLRAREAAEAAHPLDEEAWPLRALFGTDGTRNATHGSDSA